MAQFVVYQNKDTNTKKVFPMLLDVQSNLLDALQTTVVIPLRKYEPGKEKILSQLTPVLDIDGSSYVMLTPQMAGIVRKQLGSQVCNLLHLRTEIINALDFLLTGV